MEDTADNQFEYCPTVCGEAGPEEVCTIKLYEAGQEELGL